VYAAHLHAGMAAFDDDRDAQGIELVFDGIGDLEREAFLHLRAAGEAVNGAGEFTEADDLAARGEVGDVGFAEEGQEVMLAEAVELDIAEDDGAITLLVKLALQVKGGVFAQAGAHFAEGASNAPGGIEEAVAGRVLAEGDEEFADGALDASGVEWLEVLGG